MIRILIAGVLLCFSCNISFAKYCVKLPTCEELGYVFKAKDNRRQIRCPFDTDMALYLDYCQAYGIQGEPDSNAGEYQECIEEKADGTKINTGYYRYTRCNVGYTYKSGQCIESTCDGFYSETNEIDNCANIGECQKGKDKVYKCVECAEGYGFENNECIQTCLFTEVTPIANCIDAPCRRAGVEYYDSICTTCSNGYTSRGTSCVANTCDGYTSTTPNITGCETVSSPCLSGSTNKYKCDACSDGYESDGNGGCKQLRVQYAVGDIYYHNGTAIGVVFYDDGTTTKIVAPSNINRYGTESDDSNIYWSDCNLSQCKPSYYTGNSYCHTDTEAINDMDGNRNTNIILSYIASNDYEADAATATSLYAPSVCDSGTYCGKGKWYLPALGELRTIYLNESKIRNPIMYTLRGAWFSSKQYFWSSTEISSTAAWYFNFSNGSRDYGLKYNAYYIRPVLAF